MQRMAACLASWFSVDGPLVPDCSAPLSQVTKLNTADSPLVNTGAQINSFRLLGQTSNHISKHHIDTTYCLNCFIEFNHSIKT